MKNVRKFKFIGSQSSANNYIKPVTIGGIYQDDYFMDKLEGTLIGEDIIEYDWEEVVEGVELAKKYKLLNGEGWESSFKEGGIYNGSTKNEYGMTVEEIATEGKFAEDWEEVVDKLVVELPKKFKFKGDLQACGEDGSYGGLVVGEVYSLTDRCPWNEDNGDLDKYNFVKYYVEMYPNDWEEVLVSSSPTGSGNVYVRSATKIFTDAEVVTLITFLNDNFEDFEDFVNGDSKDGGLSTGVWVELRGGILDASSLLIDKLEKNNTPLTEAEKVTLITFLNGRFEDFRTFTIYDLDFEFYDKLDADEEFEVASLLIDKIELS